MKRNWISIGLITGLGLLGGAIAAGVSIYNKISYDMLSYTVWAIDKRGITIRLIFGVSNASSFDLDLWNQHYEVYVSGYKVSEISSPDRYKIFSKNTTLIPLDVRLLWDELQANIAPIGGQLQVNALSSLPVFIAGNLSAGIGTIGLRKIPVRVRTTVGEFLP